MTTSYDVIVLGLGGMGSAAAYHLAARGLRVLGLEQFTPGHNLGSSHGGTRIIREAYFEDPAYVPLVQHAYTLWQRLEQATGQQLLQITGGLVIGQPDSELVTGALASARLHDLPHTILSTQDLRERYPMFAFAPHEIGVYEPRAGFLRPEACVLAHLEVAARSGAELHFEERVIGWEASDERVEVETERGRYSAGRLVITAGPWAGELIRELAPQLRVERVPVFWFDPQHMAAAFAPQRCPIYIWQREDVGFFYGFPLIDGRVKVARHYAGGTTTAATIDRTVHQEEIDELREILTGFIPGLSSEPVHTSVCMYTNSPDLHFIIDRHPAHANVVVAAGFSGHGFKFSPVIGEMLATMTLDAAAAPLDLFRWSRLSV
ncbi:MAG TPA: N-methyl-L-tryptophan oxidase [Herpetosiphonaceae bacterium]